MTLNLNENKGLFGLPPLYINIAIIHLYKISLYTLVRLIEKGFILSIAKMELAICLDCTICFVFT